MHQRTREVAGKSRNHKGNTGESALDRVRRGFRLRRHQSTVCVLSSHPVVLQHLEKAIDKDMFRVHAERLRPFGYDFDGTHVLANTPLCVLDALGPRPASAAVFQHILQVCPHTRVLLVTERDAESECFELLLLGAKGLLTYSEAPEQLSRALTCIGDGGFWLSPLRLSRFVDSFLGRHHQKQLSGSILSRRENEIVQKLFQNSSNKEIANELNITERTVKFHVSNLLQKFGVHSRMELVLSYGPPAPTWPRVGCSRQEQLECENLARRSQGQRPFLPGIEDEDENILPIPHRPAYSVS